MLGGFVVLFITTIAAFNVNLNIQKKPIILFKFS